jgi:hypothetical protein
MRAQFPGLPQPTLEELQDCFKNPIDEDAGRAAGVVNENNFTFDQLGATLYTWGAYRGIELQMGVLFNKDYPFVCPIPNQDPDRDDEDRLAKNLVWVHNNSSAEQAKKGRQEDNALAAARGASLDVTEQNPTGGLNHYSGVRHKT